MVLAVDIALPVLNEAGTLRAQIHRILDYTRSYSDGRVQIKMVIADNGSTDGTEAIGRELADAHADVAFQKVDQPGVGRALKAAWSASSADIVGYMDLDLATDIRHLEDVLTPLVEDRTDLAVGSRLMPGAQVIGRSAKREFVSRTFNAIVRTVFATKFTDGMCGFKFLQRRWVETLIDCGAKSDGWFFSTELLICAEHLGLRMTDVPVRWHDDPQSKAKVSKLTFEYLSAMRKLKANLRRRTS